MKRQGQLIAFGFIAFAAAILIALFAVKPVEAKAEGHTNHCICGGNGTCIATATSANGHTAKTPAGGWQEAADDTTFRSLISNTESGGEVFIYLGASFEMSDSHIEVAGKTIHICLNGNTITTKSTRRLFYLNLRNTLTICDCSEGETGKITAPSGATGVDGVGGLIRCVGSTVELYSGTLANGVSRNSNNGGCISLVKSTSAGSSTLRMYGGTITGGKAGNRSGNVDVSESSFYMYGGTISGGNSTKWGGNVSLAASSTFTMEGGTITGGKAGSYGGNVVINASSATFTMNGGTITGGTSTTSGGNVYNAGTFTMNDGTISTGKSTTHGGNIATEKPFTMEGGTITGGTATTYGGNVSVTTNGTFNLKGGTISGGKAGSYDGWNIFTEGQFHVSGNPVITNTPPSGSYYDVYNKKICTIKGSPVFKVDTTGTARGIKSNTTSATMTIDGGSFIANVFAIGGAELTINGGTFAKNVYAQTSSNGTGSVTVNNGYFSNAISPTTDDPGTVTINGGYFKVQPAATADNANVTYSAGLWTINGDCRIPFQCYGKYKEVDGSSHNIQMNYTVTSCKQISGMNMILNENLALGLYANVDLSEPLYKNGSNVGKISVTLNGETKEANLSDLSEVTWNALPTRMFVYDGVTPELMGDEISVTLYASDGTTELHTKTYTIKGYLETLKASTAAELGMSDAKKAALDVLVDDLLVYGGAAQTKFNHNTANLVSDGVTGSGNAPISVVERKITNKTEVTAQNYQDASVIPGYFKEATVIHENINWIRVKYADNANDGGTTFKLQKGNAAAVDVTLDNGYLCTEGLMPTEYDTKITFYAYRGSDEISKVEYSMNAYCLAKHNATGHEFSDALYNYGASAAAFAAAN